MPHNFALSSFLMHRRMLVFGVHAGNAIRTIIVKTITIAMTIPVG